MKPFRHLAPVATCIAALALSLSLATPGMAEDICGPDAYVESVSQKQGREVIICACAPGFTREDVTCERQVPAMLTKQATLLVPWGQSGTVNAYIVHTGQRIIIPTEHMFYANALSTGPQSQLTAYVARNLRLRMGADSRLRLGAYENTGDAAAGLNIMAMTGLMRLDTESTQAEKDKLAAFYARAGKFIRDIPTDPFTVRTPAGILRLPGGDAVIEGRNNGDVIVHVLSGAVTLTSPQDKTDKLVLTGGDSGVMRPGMAPRLLARNQARKITKLWESRAATN